jgi:hypothetical protein
MHVIAASFVMGRVTSSSISLDLERDRLGGSTTEEGNYGGRERRLAGNIHRRIAEERPNDRRIHVVSG